MVDKEERNFLFILLVSILFLNIYLCQKTKIDEGFNPVKEIKKLGKTVTKLPKTIKNQTTGMINSATSSIKNEFNGIINKVESTFTGLINQLESTFTGLINKLNNVINEIKNQFTKITNEIKKGIVEMKIKNKKDKKETNNKIDSLPRTIVNGVISLIPIKAIRKFFRNEIKDSSGTFEMLIALAFGILKLTFAFFIMPYLIILASYQGIMFGVSSVTKAMVMSFSYMINPPKKNVDLSMLGDVLDIQEQMSSNQEQKLNQLQQKLGKMDRMINR